MVAAAAAEVQRNEETVKPLSESVLARIYSHFLSVEDCMLLFLGTVRQGMLHTAALCNASVVYFTSRLPFADLQLEKTGLTRACLQAVPTCISQSYARHLHGLSEAALSEPQQIYLQH